MRLNQEGCSVASAGCDGGGESVHRVGLCARSPGEDFVEDGQAMLVCPAVAGGDALVHLGRVVGVRGVVDLDLSRLVHGSPRLRVRSMLLPWMPGSALDSVGVGGGRGNHQGVRLSRGGQPMPPRPRPRTTTGVDVGNKGAAVRKPTDRARPATSLLQVAAARACDRANGARYHQPRHIRWHREPGDHAPNGRRDHHAVASGSGPRLCYPPRRVDRATSAGAPTYSPATHEIAMTRTDARERHARLRAGVGRGP